MGENIGRAITAIYDAVLSDIHWPAALDAFAREIGSVGAVLVAVDKVGLPFTILQATSNYPIEDVHYYFDNLGHYDEPEMTSRFAVTPRFQLLRDEDVWGDVSKLDDRPDYKWVRGRIGAHRRAGIRLSSNRGWMDLVALQFAERDWREVPHSMEINLGKLAPHLAKAVEVNRTFGLLRESYRAVMSALDYFRLGIAIVTPSGTVVAENRELRRLLELKDGLHLSRTRRLECSSSSNNGELLAAIAEVSATSAGAGEKVERLLFVERRSGKRPFLVEVAPLRDVTGELDRGFAGAVVFVIDPEDTRAISTERLARLFVLSQAESEVVRAMVDGLSAAEIAELRGTTDGTVRSQIKSIYAKTGVRRRADLVRLAVSVDPPIQRGNLASTGATSSPD